MAAQGYTTRADRFLRAARAHLEHVEERVALLEKRREDVHELLEELLSYDGERLERAQDVDDRIDELLDKNRLRARVLLELIEEITDRA